MSLEGGPLRSQSSRERDIFLASVPRILVKRLEVAYPPAKIWMAETSEIVHLWQDEIRTRKLKDNRLKGRATLRDVEVLDTTRLQHVVREDQDCILVDSETGELVGNVFRNFSKDPEVLQWLDDRVKFNIRHRRGARVSI